jgi:hypothetical protein
MKIITFIVLAIAMLPINIASCGELSDWRARLVDRIYWFESEKTLEDLKNKEADIQAWKNHQPDINRIYKKSSGPGEIYFNDISELFEHIEYIVENYDIVPERRAAKSDIDLVRGFSLEKLMEMMEQGESGRFMHSALDKLFYDPEGIKIILGRLRTSGRKYGFSEKDRVAAMKMLAKALAQATQASNKSQNLYKNILSQQHLIQTDLTDMYDLLINTNPTEKSPDE